MISRLILLAWLLYLAFAGYLLTQHTDITSDLTFFLPKATTPQAQLLLTATREGPGSHMLLAEISGGTEKERFAAGDALVSNLRSSSLFARVQNGIDPQDLYHLEERLFPYRFVLTSSSPDEWDAHRLHEALQQRATALYSGTGRLEERWLERDPLGRWKQFLDQLSTGPMPKMLKGHWVNGSGDKALILIETRTPGFDLEAQKIAQQRVQSAFDTTSLPGLTLKMGGAGALAVETNRSITLEATWLSLANTLMVSILLMLVYRSWRILILGLIPLLTGLLTGALAIRLQFGAIHAITLGFGSTLMGVAADYPNHFFTHLNPNISNQTTMQRLWPTLRLGILTNIAGFGVMFFSGFRGLQEIGIFAAAGLIGAGLSTRFILPLLSPPSSGVGKWMATLPYHPIQRISQKWRFLFCVLVLIVLGILFVVSGRSLFNDDLSSLNPVNPSQLESDLQLQRAFRVPDMRWLVLVTGSTENEALARSENLKPVLSELVVSQAISGFDLVSDVLPSQKMQSLRNTALPAPKVALEALNKALRGTPFKATAFAPLIDDLSVNNLLPPLSHETLKDTLLEPKINATIFNTSGGTAIVVPIEGIARMADIQAAIQSLQDPQIQLIDLQDALTQRIRENRKEASHLLLSGLATIFVILAFGLRSQSEAGRVMVPMLLASLSTGLLMAILSNGLNIYHLASILLVMGLSLDQALFFNRSCSDPEERAKTHLSILLCSLSSILAFGGLAFASVPLLSAIGMTVSIGAFLAVSFALLLAK